MGAADARSTAIKAAAVALLWAFPSFAVDGGTQVPDSGTSGVPITAPTLISLFKDYGCNEAPPMVQVALPDGGQGWLATDARKRRIDCALAGAQGELNAWRPSPTAIGPKNQGFQFSLSHGVVGLITATITTYLAVVKTRADQHCRGAANPFGPCN